MIVILLSGTFLVLWTEKINKWLDPKVNNFNVNIKTNYYKKCQVETRSMT